MKYEQLSAHLKEKLLPCYVVSGDDAGLIKSAIKQFCALVGDFAELNIVYMQQESQAVQILETAELLPVMADYRIVISPQKSPQDIVGSDSFKRYLENPAPQTIIILSQITDTVKSFKGVEVVDCMRLSADTLAEQVVKMCDIVPSAARLLIEYCGRFFDRIQLEAQKLTAYKKGGRIVDDDVRLLVPAELEYRAYELGEAMSKRDCTKALAIIEDMMQGGAGAWNRVFGLIYSHFRRLLYISLSGDEAALAASLEMKEYAVKMLMRQARAFSKVELKQLTDMLHEIDNNIKTGKISYKNALETFVVSSCAI